MLIMMWLKLWTCVVLFNVGHSARKDQEKCSLPNDLVKEIKSYQGFINEIIAATTNGSYSGVLHKNLTDFTIAFGQRKSGTPNLESATLHLSTFLSKSGLFTKAENVSVPLWLRGNETAYYIRESKKRNLRIKGLGNTPSGNVTAPLLVVKDFMELEQRKCEVPGKIVLFNAEFKAYTSTVAYRNHGPSEASKLGAVGALVRSVTPFSVGSIHVGMTQFEDQVKPIPAAAISLEDADILNIMLRNNESITVNIQIDNASGVNKTKNESNLIADIPGHLENTSYVTVSGHIDSWDVGQGVLDDGGGALLTLHSLLLLKHLNITSPKRTLRAILWTGEELGYYGAKAYAEAHKNELLNWSAAIQSDSGLLNPLGFTVKASKNASCILQEIANLFSSLNSIAVERINYTNPTDISVFDKYQVPLIETLLKPNDYFWYHHSEGDSLRVINSTVMDQHLALVTGTAYILANLSLPMPRNDSFNA